MKIQDAHVNSNTFHLLVHMGLKEDKDETCGHTEMGVFLTKVQEGFPTVMKSDPKNKRRSTFHFAKHVECIV